MPAESAWPRHSLAGTNVDNLFKLAELGDCAGVLDYAHASLVGRAQQNEQLGESGLRWRLHRPFAAALSIGLDARRRLRTGWRR